MFLHTGRRTDKNSEACCIFRCESVRRDNIINYTRGRLCHVQHHYRITRGLAARFCCL